MKDIVTQQKRERTWIRKFDSFSRRFLDRLIDYIIV